MGGRRGEKSRKSGTTKRPKHVSLSMTGFVTLPSQRPEGLPENKLLSAVGYVFPFNGEKEDKAIWFLPKYETIVIELIKFYYLRDIRSSEKELTFWRKRYCYKENVSAFQLQK